MTQWIKWGSTAYAMTTDGTLGTRTHSIALMRGNPAVLMCWRREGSQIIGRVEYPGDAVGRKRAMLEAREICEQDQRRVGNE